MKIEIELRPCYAKNKNAIFHRWIVSERDSYSMPPRKIPVIEALIEYEDGTMGLEEASYIKFIDSKHEGYFWDKEE